MCPTGSNVDALFHNLWCYFGGLGILGTGTSQRKWGTRGKTLKGTSVPSLFSISCPQFGEQPPPPHASVAMMLSLIRDARTWCLTKHSATRSQNKHFHMLSSFCQAPCHRDEKTGGKVFSTSEYHLLWICLGHICIHRILQYFYNN